MSKSTVDNIAEKNEKLAIKMGLVDLYSGSSSGDSCNLEDLSKDHEMYENFEYVTDDTGITSSSYKDRKKKIKTRIRRTSSDYGKEGPMLTMADPHPQDDFMFVNTKDRGKSPPIDIQTKSRSDSNEKREETRAYNLACAMLNKVIIDLKTGSKDQPCTKLEHKVAESLEAGGTDKKIWLGDYLNEIQQSLDIQVAAIKATHNILNSKKKELAAENDDLKCSQELFKLELEGGSKTRKKSNIFRKNKISRKYIMSKQCGGAKAKSGSKSNPYSSKRKASRSRRRVCYYKKKGRTLKMKKKKKKSRKRRR